MLNLKKRESSIFAFPFLFQNFQKVENVPSLESLRFASTLTKCKPNIIYHYKHRVYQKCLNGTAKITPA